MFPSAWWWRSSARWSADSSPHRTPSSPTLLLCGVQPWRPSPCCSSSSVRTTWIALRRDPCQPDEVSSWPWGLRSSSAWPWSATPMVGSSAWRPCCVTAWPSPGWGRQAPSSSRRRPSGSFPSWWPLHHRCSHGLWTRPSCTGCGASCVRRRGGSSRREYRIWHGWSASSSGSAGSRWVCSGDPIHHQVLAKARGTAPPVAWLVVCVGFGCSGRSWPSTP